MHIQVSRINGGAYKRVLLAYEFLHMACPALDHCIATYIRNQIQFIESLSFYIMDMTNETLYRHQSIGRVHIHALDADVLWVSAQISFALISGNDTVLTVSSDVHHVIQTHINQSEQLSVIFFNDFPFETSSAVTTFTYSSPILKNIAGDPILTTVYPDLIQLLHRDVKNAFYLKERYNLSEVLLTDEFDLLPRDTREQFVSERREYLFTIISQRNPYYRRINIDSCVEKKRVVSAANILDGHTLSSNVPPLGSDIISVNSSGNMDKYQITFSTGGSTGRAKYVYRQTWEDEENARYIAKGLYAQGISRDVKVMNCLGAGLWGGMHVFNLALKYTGCGVIPVGCEFSEPQIAAYVRDLQPDVILGMPSFLLKIAEYVSRSEQKLQVKAVITGGEQLFDEMKSRISSALGVTSFLSTGYTSNETGAIGFRCPFLAPSHFHIHENMQDVHVVSLDPDNTSECVSEGDVGRLIVSNLNRTYMPTVMYDIGDSGMILPSTEQPCLCGRRLQVMCLLGRCDDRLRLGAEDVSVQDIATAIGTIEGLSMNFAIHATRSKESGRDVLEVKVELNEDYSHASDEWYKNIKTQLLKAISQTTSLRWEEQEKLDCHRGKPVEGLIDTPVISLLGWGELPRNSRTGKIKRVVDERHYNILK